MIRLKKTAIDPLLDVYDYVNLSSKRHHDRHTLELYMKTLSFLRPFFLPFLILVGIGVIISNCFSANSPQHQHDFVSYYYGTKAKSAGLNPYTSESLAKMIQRPLDSHIRFVYPPQMTLLFNPFMLLPFETARTAFLAFKVVALIALFGVWIRYFKPHPPHWLAFTLISLFAFHGAISCDLHAGNISTFESLLLWLGFGIATVGHLMPAAALIAMGASFKLTPIVFLGILALSRSAKKWRAILIGAVIFATIQGIGLYLTPGLYQQFLSSGNLLDSTGFTNPSALAFFRYDVAPILAQHISINAAQIGQFMYIIWLIIIGTLFILWMRRRHLYTLFEIINIVVLFYALVMPRFKDYTFIMLIIPAWHAVSIIQNPWIKWTVVTLLLVTLWPYHHLTMTLLLLGISLGPRIYRRQN